MVSGLTTATVFLFLTHNAWAIERVVILAPAAADILYRLGAHDTVVGVTNSVAEFPEAVKVGTHLHPGIEKIALLRPTLIISSSKFDPELASRMGAEHFLYEPGTLDEIIEDIRILGRKIDRGEEGERLAGSLERILHSLRLPENPPTVVYETRSTPLAIAKNKTVIKDILERAGMRYAYPQSTGMVSAEYLLAYQPDYYMYQEGPMNKNPIPPHERNGWDRLASCVWKVDEFEFARANTRLFTTVSELNAILNSDSPCDAGKKRYPE